MKKGKGIQLRNIVTLIRTPCLYFRLYKKSGKSIPDILFNLDIEREDSLHRPSYKGSNNAAGLFAREGLDCGD